MADLSSRERRKLEQTFAMGGGYVLNFSDKTIGEFFDEYVGRDINSQRYLAKGTSKANRLRTFWEVEPNGVVAKSISALIDHAREFRIHLGDPQLMQDVQAIITRLNSSMTVPDIEAIASVGNDRDFEAVAEGAREAIEKNQPQVGLDRLHTFLVKYIRILCAEHGQEMDRDVPLNGLFGAYVKKLKAGNHLSSDMAERILKSSISNFEAFNFVRNNQSLAHDNKMLDYNEALLIFNHVASTVRFIKSVEAKRKLAPKLPDSNHWGQEDIPF